jgi:hypothetical protein
MIETHRSWRRPRHYHLLLESLLQELDQRLLHMKVEPRSFIIATQHWQVLLDSSS